MKPVVAWWRLDRLGRSSPPIEKVIPNARSFGAMVGEVGRLALVARHDGYGPVTYLAAPALRGDQVAGALGDSVGARPEPADPPDLAEARRLGWLEARPEIRESHENQAGGDPAAVARILARALVPGAWVALALRAPTRSERNRGRRWFRAQDVAHSHYSAEEEVLVASACAGAPDVPSLRVLLKQLASALPGFEVHTAAVAAWAPPWPLPAGLGLGAGVAGLVTGHAALGGVAAGLCALPAAGLATGVLPTAERRLRRALAAGLLPAPPKRRLPPRAPRPQRTVRGGPDHSDRVVPAQPGDWPLAKRAFLAGSAMVVGVASPHGGSAEPGATRAQAVPSDLTADIGPLVGMGADGQRVHVSAAPEDVGVAVLGIPGTGKTALVQALWAWSCLERARPSAKPGRPGADQVLVAFETKGAGPGEWVTWAKAVGVRPLVVSLTDGSTPAIDLFAGPGGVAERAGRLVDSMVYAFGDQAIQGRSTEALMAALCGALVASPEALDAAALAGAGRLRAAHVLLGGEGDQAAVRLAASLAIGGDGSEEHADALRRLAPLFGQGVSASVRRGLTEAARNKLGLLREAGDWWSPGRRQVTWDDVIAHRAVVVLVTSGAKGALAQTLSAMLAWALRDSVARLCDNWQAKGRSVGIFADELASLAGTSPEVVAWMRSEGRSFGVRPVLATQYPEQLAPAVRTALLSFGSTVWFRQNVPSVVAEATAYLQMAGGPAEWVPEDLDGLPPYNAVLRASFKGRGLAPVVMSVPYFAGDKAGFAALQGY